MIDPKEVRISNLVKYENRVFEIHTIAEEFPTLNTSEFGIGVVDWNNIEPVELTEEWLKKLGWVLSDDKFNGLSYYYFSQKIDYIIVIEEGLILYAITWWNYLGHTMMIRETDPYYEFHTISNIHQLQNLFYSLTNQDLTIKQ